MDNNWTINQTQELFGLVFDAAAAGRGLQPAFVEMAERSGRSVNSVRNYYYSQLKMFELVPSLASDLNIKIVGAKRGEFEVFSSEEIRELIESILIAKADGKSVRATIASMAGGDAKKALRLQNKYRSMISHHKERVEQIMHDLTKRQITYYNPYSKQKVDETANDNLNKLNEYIQKLDSTEVGSFLSIIRKLM